MLADVAHSGARSPLWRSAAASAWTSRGWQQTCTGATRQLLRHVTLCVPAYQSLLGLSHKLHTL